MHVAMHDGKVTFPVVLRIESREKKRRSAGKSGVLSGQSMDNRSISNLRFSMWFLAYQKSLFKSQNLCRAAAFLWAFISGEHHDEDLRAS